MTAINAILAKSGPKSMTTEAQEKAAAFLITPLGEAFERYTLALVRSTQMLALATEEDGDSEELGQAMEDELEARLEFLALLKPLAGIERA